MKKLLELFRVLGERDGESLSLIEFKCPNQLIWFLVDSDSEFLQLDPNSRHLNSEMLLMENPNTRMALEALS